LVVVHLNTVPKLYCWLVVVIAGREGYRGERGRSRRSVAAIEECGIYSLAEPNLKFNVIVKRP